MANPVITRTKTALKKARSTWLALGLGLGIEAGLGTEAGLGLEEGEVDEGRGEGGEEEVKLRDEREVLEGLVRG